MTSLLLSEFTGYDEDTFHAFLNLHPRPMFEIRQPRFYKGEEDYLLVIDYYLAAFTGQRLSRVGEDFWFTIPDPHSDDDFSFIIEVYDREALARELAAITRGLAEESTDDVLDYYTQAAAFALHLPEGVPLACEPYFSIIAGLEGWE